MLKQATRVLPQQLCQSIPEGVLTFNHTGELDGFHGVLGQERAINAIQFGVAMRRPGYNIFVMGDVGTGRSSYVQDYLKSEAKREATPDVWCYVNNFRNPREPRALKLKAHDAQPLRQLLLDLIEQLLATFPAAFEHPTYQQKKSAIDYTFNRRYDRALEQVEREAHKRSLAVYRDASTISFTPMRDGKALDETEFAQLPEAEREQFHEHIAELEQLLSDSLSELPQWRRESSNEQRQLDNDTVRTTLEPLFAPLRAHFAEQTALEQYLQEMAEFLPRIILEELIEERPTDTRDEYSKRHVLEETLLPNIVTHHQPDSGAPVVYEPHPSFANLFGRVEYSNEQGALITNFQRLSPGALHKANGGYLVLDAEKVLADPMAWEALKRSLQARQLKMESPYSDFGLIHTTSLNPQVIDLQFKLVLIGSRQIYYLLQEYDADFKRLFRAVVDFDSDLPLNEQHLLGYARLLKSRADEQQFAPLTRAAVERMVQYSVRLAEQQNVLSARIGEQFDLLAEADFIRQLAQDEYLDAHHIERALKAKNERTGRIYDKLFQQMMDDIVLLQTQGTAIGKINGLTVMSLDDTHFGSPARITVTAYPGSRGVIDIEREASLGQAIHSKGVMILSGFLGNRYAQKFPLAISAHIAMEQSYGYIDGDSASLAELVCLISALIEAPIEQSFAITGSVNQYGEVQAIGGVNEKIEGFFRLCQARGLTGNQGVIIPESNRHNLALNDEVVAAVANNEFHIHCVCHVDQALELLLNRPAGELNDRGKFPKGSINSDVIKRLKAIAKMGSKPKGTAPKKKKALPA